jgi:hypothetical protein
VVASENFRRKIFFDEDLLLHLCARPCFSRTSQPFAEFGRMRAKQSLREGRQDGQPLCPRLSPPLAKIYGTAFKSTAGRIRSMTAEPADFQMFPYFHSGGEPCKQVFQASAVRSSMARSAITLNRASISVEVSCQMLPGPAAHFVVKRD